MKKLIYILIDGVADRPVQELGNKTPLEAAYTPNIDRIAEDSVFGQVVTVGEGIAPESDVAVFSMLGYSFKKYPGRGVIEAVGAGIDFKDGELAMRANFATADDDMRFVLDRRAGRNLSEEEARLLEEEINSKVKLENASFTFKHTVGHRAVLVIRYDGDLSSEISNTDPGYAREKGMGVAVRSSESSWFVPCKALSDKREAIIAAELVNEFTRKSFEVLKRSEVNAKRIKLGYKPANLILLRDAGDSYPHLETLYERYGKRFSAVVDMPVEIGISKLTGMNVAISDKEDYVKKAELTYQLINQSDSVYIHLKGPDEFGHDGLAEEKKEAIEKIDSEYFGSLLSMLKNDIVIAVSADHATPCSLKAHSDDPVPLMVSNSSAGKDGLKRFTELSGKNGSIGMLKGINVLSYILSVLE